MRRLFWAAAIYTVLGLAGGLFYRELTKAEHFTGRTELAVVHTHLLALGMLMFLVLLALERAFALTANRKLFAAFFWLYNVGLVVTVVMMVTIGTRTVFGRPTSEALAGVAGLGHILLTVALVLLFVCLGRRVGATARNTRE